VLVPGLDVVPSTVRLAAAELPLLRDAVTGIQKLSSAIRRVEGQYDWIFADCPPTLGLLSLGAIVGCPDVLVPVKLAAATLPGLADLMQILEVVRDSEPQVRVMGVLGTSFVEGANGPKDALAFIREQFGAAVFDTVIHRAQGVEDACGAGVPVCLSAPKSRGAAEYQSVIQEVLARGGAASAIGAATPADVSSPPVEVAHV
jgi:chromosome partitioning protein